MGTKLYVGNLLYETTEDELKDFFSQVGSVLSAQIIRYRDGKSKGFGFVEMSSAEEMNAAVEKFNGQDFKGRRLVVAEARPPRPREDRGSYRQDRPHHSSPSESQSMSEASSDMGEMSPSDESSEMPKMGSDDMSSDMSNE